MHLKKYRARTTLEAVREVREELGPDALILSVEPVRSDRGLLGRMGRSLVEVTAAVDRDVRSQGEEAAARVQPDGSWRELQVSRALVAPLEQELRALRTVVERLDASVPDACEVGRSLDLLRRTAERGQTYAHRTADPTVRIADRLLASGLSLPHALSLGEEVAQRVEPGEDSWGSLLRNTLAARLDARLLPPRRDRKVRAELFVGATGAGKTTTLAKLAGAGTDDGRGLAVVTTDGHRLGGEEPLRSYAEQIDVPFRVALSPTELKRTRSRIGRRHLLVDTAGRSPGDAESMGELVRCREVLGRRTRVHLVLSATTKEEDLVEQLNRHRPLRPDGIVVTRVDESRSLANIANLILDPEAPPLTWLGNGQGVPDDLELPDPERLAERVLEIGA